MVNLYTEQRAIDDLRAGISPVSVSLLKWQAIRDALEEISGVANSDCGFCLYYDPEAISCASCPLYDTGQDDCCTEYRRVDDGLGGLLDNVELLIERINSEGRKEAGDVPRPS